MIVYLDLDPEVLSNACSLSYDPPYQAPLLTRLLLLSVKEQISREHSYLAFTMNSTNICSGQALKNSPF